jgi:hypothetical protein
MCLTLADYDFNGEISPLDMEESINKVTQLIYSNKKTTEGRGPDPLAVITKTVLDFLIASHDQEMSRKQLLWKGYGTYNSFTLDQAIENLLEMGWIKKVKTGVGSNMDWNIKLSGEPLESYKKHIASKAKN